MSHLKGIVSDLGLYCFGVMIGLGILLLQRRDAGLDRATELAATVLLISVWVGLFTSRGFYRVHRRLEELERTRKDPHS